MIKVFLLLEHENWRCPLDHEIFQEDFYKLILHFLMFWINNTSLDIHTLLNDPTRDSIANNFVIGVYCRYLQILYQIAFFYKI